MRAKSIFPVRYVIFAGPDRGKVVGVAWFDFASDEVYDVIEDRAAFHAKMRDSEIDIEIGAVMPSGAIGSYDRAGIRVRP